MTIEKLAFVGLAVWVTAVLVYGMYRSMTDRVAPDRTP